MHFMARAHRAIFRAGPDKRAGLVLITSRYDHSDIALAPYGEYWREIRKIAVLELLTVRRIQSFESVRKEEIDLLLDAIITTTRGGNDNNNDDDDDKRFNLSQAMLNLSNNLICRVAFGKKWGGGGDNDEFKSQSSRGIDKVTMESQALLGEVNLADFYPWLGWVFNKFNGFDKRLDDNFQEIDRFFNEVIEDHRIRRAGVVEGSLEYEDIVDVLLRVQGDLNQSIRLTDKQIKGVLVDIFIAGTDTTAATVVWTMSELIRNPTILKRAQEEVRAFVKGRNNQPQILESDLANNHLPYLKMVIKESLRLNPPVPLLIPRETTAPCEIQGYHVPAKTRVFVNAWAISRDPEYWVDPNRFNPERFFDDESVDFKGQHFGFIPFGVGRRICPGMNFAMVMVELVLANLLCRFDWELPNGVTDVDMEEAVGITCHKKKPLVLVARPVAQT